jgi:hypothetical protein
MASLKDRVLDLLRDAHATKQAFVNNLSEGERTEKGTPALWSAKDHVAHITMWQQRTVRRLDAGEQGEPPITDHEEELRLNEQTFQEQHDRSWQDVLADSEQTFAQLVGHIEKLTDDELLDPNRFHWQLGRSLASRLASGSFYHLLAHLAQYCADRKDIARANQIHEQIADKLIKAGDEFMGRPYVVYNLACHYATTDQADKALPLLSEAFQIEPSLVEWAKQDSDMDPLRNNPAFQALQVAATSAQSTT